jgi:hypothetical protein
MIKRAIFNEEFDGIVEFKSFSKKTEMRKGYSFVECPFCFKTEIKNAEKLPEFRIQWEVREYLGTYETTRDLPENRYEAVEMHLASIVCGSRGQKLTPCRYHGKSPVFESWASEEIIHVEVRKLVYGGWELSLYQLKNERETIWNTKIKSYKDLNQIVPSKFKFFEEAILVCFEKLEKNVEDGIYSTDID